MTYLSGQSQTQSQMQSQMLYHGTYSIPINCLESITGQYHGISTLESAVHSYQPATHSSHPFSVSTSFSGYNGRNAVESAPYTHAFSSYLLHPAKEYFTPIMFLKDHRSSSPFIGKSEDVRHYVMAAFEATMGRALPDDILIRIVTKGELREKHEAFGGEWNEGIQGFAINRNGISHSMIFVKENELDQLMLVIGHEIGHCMSRTLPSKHDEEAKAFAFELAWMEALTEHDIAHMKDAIDLDPRPANNGLHNVAFNFVKRLARQGRKSLKIFRQLIHGELQTDEKTGEGNVWQ